MIERLHKWLDIPYRLAAHSYGDWSDDGKPVIVLLHGIGANHKVWKVLIDKLPNHPILAIDLLGFGSSRKPKLVDYSLRDQVRALDKTIRAFKIKHRDIILCGHSLGSLVAIGYAKDYPERISRLFLCSPPIYDMGRKDNFPSREALLEQVGRRFLKAIETEDPRIISATNAYRVHQRNFRIDPENVSPFVKTARQSIMNQTALTDITKIKIPIKILYGTLDTVMIPSNFRRVRKKNANISISSVAAAHEMNSIYLSKLAKLIYPRIKKIPQLPSLKIPSLKRKNPSN